MRGGRPGLNKRNAIGPVGNSLWLPHIHRASHHLTSVGAGLLAKAVYQAHWFSLTYRIREQARSHRGLHRR